MVQLIEKQKGKFYININGIECFFMPINLYVGNDLFPLKPKIKKSTLHWYVNRKYVSYNQIKKAILK